MQLKKFKHLALVLTLALIGGSSALAGEGSSSGLWRHTFMSEGVALIYTVNSAGYIFGQTCSSLTHTCQWILLTPADCNSTVSASIPSMMNATNQGTVKLSLACSGTKKFDGRSYTQLSLVPFNAVNPIMLSVPDAGDGFIYFSVPMSGGNFVIISYKSEGIKDAMAWMKRFISESQKTRNLTL